MSTIAFIIPVITLILFIGLVILLLVLLYKYLYKRQLNYALRHENDTKSVGFMEPINFIFSIIFIIILILSIVMLTKINRISDELTNANNSLNRLQQSYNYLESKSNTILGKIQEQIDKDKWINTSSYEYLDFTEDKLHYNVKINFSIKELQKDAKLYLLVTNKDDDNSFQKIEVEYKGFLTFVQTIELPLNQNYQIYLASETDSNTTQEHLLDINLKDHFDYRISDFDYTFKNDNFNFTIVVDNYGIPKFKIKTVNIIILEIIENEEQAFENGEKFDITNKVTITEVKNQQVIKGSYPINSKNQLMIKLELEDYFGNIINSKYFEHIYYQG
jgi:heme/copper-type cytochrome/quinol oxidase subunit 2